MREKLVGLKADVNLLKYEKQFFNAASPGFIYDLMPVWWFVAGGAECEVTGTSENELQCVLQSEEETHIVTNQGFHRSRFTFRSFSAGVKLNLRRPKQRTKERGLTFRKLLRARKLSPVD